jgi:hypothetical protein
MWRWGVLFGLIVVVSVLVFVGLTQIKRVGDLWLVSCPMNFAWEINREELAKITSKMPGGQTIVYLSCTLKKTKEGAGSGEQEPFIYSERGEWMGIPEVTLYVDVPVWSDYDGRERAKVTGMFVMSQLAQLKGMDKLEVQKIKGLAYYATGGEVWLVKK